MDSLLAASWRCVTIVYVWMTFDRIWYRITKISVNFAVHRLRWRPVCPNIARVVLKGMFSFTHPSSQRHSVLVFTCSVSNAFKNNGDGHLDHYILTRNTWIFATWSECPTFGISLQMHSIVIGLCFWQDRSYVICIYQKLCVISGCLNATGGICKIFEIELASLLGIAMLH